MSNRPHSFDGLLMKKYPYCTRCGLILLKNKATEKAANKKCPGRED